MTFKRCGGCNKSKSFEEFGKHARHSDGHASQCKACIKEAYQQNREDILRRKKICRMKPERKKQEREYMRKWKARNKEQVLEYNKKYCDEHPEWARVQKRLYYRRNRNQRLEAAKEYKKNNRQLYNEIGRKRRNLKEGLPATLTEKEWQELLRLCQNKCYYCGSGFSGNNPVERDHKIPLSKGGGYTKENIVPACRNCNARKHTSTEKEFIKRIATEERVSA